MPYPSLSIDAARLENDFTELSQIGATRAGGVNRPALSNEDLQARAWFADRIEAAGLLLRDDDAGNLSGVLPARKRKAKTLLIGSHLDSVPNGGKYDGTIGVLAALEILRTVKDAGLELPVHLEAIDFTDEEGAWQGLFGSRSLTGQLPTHYTSDREADFGPFRAALFRAGIRPADVHNARRDPSTLAAYLELHIEQGQRLDREGLDIGIIHRIVGRASYQLAFFGQASHSGTTEIAARRDALLGASTFVVEAHRLWRDEFGDGIFNTGRLEISPGVSNVIPNKASLIMECRHPDEERLAEMESTLLRLAQELAVAHHLSVSSRRLAHMPVAELPLHIIEMAEAACDRCTASHRRLVSYAGHDAQMMSGFAPTGLIFIPSVGGVSHNPREFTHWAHVIKGANVLLHTALLVAESYR